MKLIIDIPESPLYRDMYTAICENGYIYDEDNEYIAEAIKNGTPLPKGHGRLIDADDIDNHIIGHVDTRCCPTIIEADKTDSEDKE